MNKRKRLTDAEKEARRERRQEERQRLRKERKQRAAEEKERTQKQQYLHWCARRRVITAIRNNEPDLTYLKDPRIFDDTGFDLDGAVEHLYWLRERFVKRKIFD